MNAKPFTDEEVLFLLANPYIAYATKYQVRYTLEFKKHVLSETKTGKTYFQIFEEAGLPRELLGNTRIQRAVQTFRKEARSPEGLKAPRGKDKEERLREQAEANLADKHTKTAIRELEERVIHLEQLVELLKKTNSLGQ